MGDRTYRQHPALPLRAATILLVRTVTELLGVPPDQIARRSTTQHCALMTEVAQALDELPPETYR